MLLAVETQQHAGDGHADTHRQLHDHRQQAVAAAGQIVGQVFQGQRIHRGKAAGVDHPLHKQHHRQQPVPAREGDGHEQQADQREADRRGHQHPTVAEAVDHLDYDALHPHAAEHHRDHHQTGVERRKAEANL